MNIMGFNVQVPGAGLDLIERYKPVASLLMDIKSEHVAEAKRLSSGTKIIFRKEDGRKWRDKDPVEWARAMWADVQGCPPGFVVPDNEPLGHDAQVEFAAFDRWQRDYADWIHANTPMRVGMFSFPEGNFTVDGPVIPECFPLSMEAADAVFIHEYWKPHLNSPGMEGYHCLRWPYWLEWFKQAGYPNLPIYVTECGVTMAVGGGPDVGYASEEAKATGVTAETYLADLEEYHRRCCAGGIKAVLPFIWCPWPGQWTTFVPTQEMTQKMFLFDAPGPTPEPEPDGGNEVEVKVYDRDGIERDQAWLEEHYGPVEIHPITEIYQPADGEIVYKVAYFREKTGDACCAINVRDQNGAPVAGETVMWGWPDAPAHEYPAKPWDWTGGKGVPGDTNANGDVGPGMGTGAYYVPPAIGPHWIWIWDRASEFVNGIGMISGTPHDHLNVGYQAVAWNDEEPTGDLETRLRAAIAELSAIADEMAETKVATLKAITLELDDGSTQKFTVSPATDALGKLWAKVRALAGHR